MTSIYQVSTAVADALTACVSNDVFTFAVVEPGPSDTIDRKKRLLSEWNEISDLIQLDLLKDVSYKFKEQIKDCQEKHGFSYKVVELTEIAIKLFEDHSHRRVN